MKICVILVGMCVWWGCVCCYPTKTTVTMNLKCRFPKGISSYGGLPFSGSMFVFGASLILSDELLVLHWVFQFSKIFSANLQETKPLKPCKPFRTEGGSWTPSTLETPQCHPDISLMCGECLFLQNLGVKHRI